MNEYNVKIWIIIMLKYELIYEWIYSREKGIINLNKK